MWLKCRYNKPLLLLALLAWATMARAQRSLLFKVEYTLGAFDVLEDSEGGIWCLRGWISGVMILREGCCGYATCFTPPVRPSATTRSTAGMW